MKQPKKIAPQIPSNRLSKTQIQPQKPNQQQYTQINKKVPLAQKSSTQLPPRVGSSQKIAYKVEDNMTNSKIHEAKMGLQLLKKKMGRAGSRQKPISIQKNQQQYIPSKKVISKPSIPQQPVIKQSSKPQTKTANKIPPSRQQPSKKTPVISNKTIQDRPIKKVPVQQYKNPNQQIPIKGNQNFMALLQKQMAKQNSKNSYNQPVKATKKPIYNQQQNQNIQLITCSKGCGRNFNPNAIVKHQKICQKVFQSKRAAFNAAQQRQPEVQDFKQPPPLPSKMQKQKPKKVSAKQQQKIPKWKLQSMAFRAGLKQGRGQKISAQQKKANDLAQGMIQCGSCGRKFNETAGKRHIAFCENKAKQMPKMNTTITKKR